jgi:catechol 2,3-dioxygenase-like lactoylglutathione lyase family enzyme
MKQLLSATTIIARDLPKLKAFYTDALGWEILNENESIVIFKLGKTALSICTPELFEMYTGVLPDDTKHKGAYFTINLNSIREVDSSFKVLIAAHVCINKMPAKNFWGGYNGFFTDPEDNLWELCYNPIPTTKA